MFCRISVRHDTNDRLSRDECEGCSGQEKLLFEPGED